MFLTLSNNKSKEERQYFPKATGNEAAGKEIFSVDLGLIKSIN